jgi:hypothetical protein
VRGGEGKMAEAVAALAGGGTMRGDAES